MKKLLFILITLLALKTTAQQTINIGEYQWHIIDNGNVYTPVGNDEGYTLTQVSGISDAVQGDGAQYTTILRTASQKVYVINGGTTTKTEYSLTEAEEPLNPTYVQGLYRSYFALSGGKVYYLPLLADEIGQNSGSTSTLWIELTQPSGGRTIDSIVSAANTDFGLNYLMAKCTDGTVWQWTSASTTPVQLTWPGGNTNAISIAMVGPVAQVIITADGAYTRGYYASLIGGTNLTHAGSFEDITEELAGPVRPWKEVKTTYTSLHFIDANDHMWAIGNNAQGIMGTGDQYPYWRTFWYNSARQPYRWSWVNGDRIKPMTQIPGEWKNLRTHNTVTSYVYAQDMGNNWYSWGRNKGRSLGNGVSMLVADEALISEYLNIPAPRKVSLTPGMIWTVLSARDTAALRTPLANAGPDQWRTAGTTSTTLYGQGSHQQQPGTTTTVTMTYAWTKQSGPSCTITSPTSANTTVTGMSAGTYVFRNTVTSAHGSDYQEVTVNIAAEEEPEPAPPTNTIFCPFFIKN